MTSYWTKILQRSRNAWQVTGRRSYNVSGTPAKLLDEDLTTNQESWQVTGRRSYNIAGTPDKLLDEDLTTYQERLNAWQVTGRRSYNVAETPDKLLDEDLTTNQESWQVTGRRSYNVAGTPDKLLDEDLTTYQERLTSYWTKILQRSRNAWQVTGRRCSDEDLTTYQDMVIGTAGHRTLVHPPKTSPQNPPKTSSRKNDKILVRFSTRRLKHGNGKSTIYRWFSHSKIPFLWNLPLPSCDYRRVLRKLVGSIGKWVGHSLWCIFGSVWQTKRRCDIPSVQHIHIGDACRLGMCILPELGWYKCHLQFGMFESMDGQIAFHIALWHNVFNQRICMRQIQFQSKAN